MGKRTEDWISFETPEGKSMLGAPSYINKLLGHDKTEKFISNIQWRIQSLERKIHRLESPQRKQQVIDLLFQEDERSRMFTWLSNRVPNLDRTDLGSLVIQGTVSTEKSGRNTMYYLTSRDTHEKRSTQ